MKKKCTLTDAESFSSRALQGKRTHRDYAIIFVSLLLRSDYNIFCYKMKEPENS